MTIETLPRVHLELQHEIEQFLYHEAALLAEREYREWLDLFAADIHYWMPTRYNRLRREAHREFSEPNETAFFDDDHESLTRRIIRLETGMAWAEDPPSRTRHLFTNVRVVPTDNVDEFDVHCNFLLYRSRLEHDVEFFVGARQDLLRRVERGVGWEIARRKVVLDQSTLNAKNLSMFF
jgi:3-phenylpropionate/trans-cinnamate dioxygenase beta subunit